MPLLNNTGGSLGSTALDINENGWVLGSYSIGGIFAQLWMGTPYSGPNIFMPSDWDPGAENIGPLDLRDNGDVLFRSRSALAVLHAGGAPLIDLRNPTHGAYEELFGLTRIGIGLYEQAVTYGEWGIIETMSSNSRGQFFRNFGTVGSPEAELVTPVPEPSTLPMLALGISLIAGLRARIKRVRS